MQVINTQVKAAVGLVSVNIEIFGGTSFSGTKSYRCTKLGDITVGSDKDNDTIMIPGSFEISFYMNEVLTTALNIVEELKIKEVTLTIYIDGAFRWSGYVEGKSVKYDTASKECKVKAYDGTKKLLEVDPATNPLGYTLNSHKKINDLVREVFQSTTLLRYPIVSTVVNKSKVQARIVDGTEYIYSFDSFYTWLDYYYGPKCGYKSVADMLKRLLINYNLMLFCGVGTTLYLLPRFAEYDSDGLYEVKRNDYIDMPEYDIIFPMNGILARLWVVGQYTGDVKNYASPIYGDWSADDEYSEEIIIDAPVGAWSEDRLEGASGLWVSHLGVNTLVDWTTQNTRRRNYNGTYSAWDDLWRYPVVDTYNQVKLPRRKAIMKVKGNYNTWKPDRYYKIEGLNNIIWRAQQFKYNLMDNNTKISLREVGTI